MSELFFPVLGVGVVFFVAVPLLSLLSRAILEAIPGGAGDALREHTRPWRYALVLGPTFGPVIWLVSAVVHQSERGTPLGACIVDHLGGRACGDVILFGMLLFAVVGLGASRRMRGHAGFPRRGVGRDEGPCTARLERLRQGHPALRAFGARIQLVDQGLAPACTRGILRPRIELEVALVERLTDEELVATLLHEIEHASARDPLRLWLGQVALSLNPLGRLLAPELARYHFAREALCDRNAVQRGASPLALASSIVSAATPRSTPQALAALGGHGIEGVRVRVQLLLGYAERKPTGEQAPGGASLGLNALLAASLIAWPHFAGTTPLDILHHAIEYGVRSLGLG